MRAVLAAALLSLPALVQAHEVLHEVRPGGAVAVRFYESDGELLARAPYQVWAPGEAKQAWQEGRTDAAGWLAFVPAEQGEWRVRVVGDDGHGLTVTLDTRRLQPARPDPQAAAPAPPATSPAGPGAAYVLRPLLGVLLVGALFGGLVLLYRRKSGR